jgi:Zn-dependent M28 family amino/carboxypeptidase
MTLKTERSKGKSYAVYAEVTGSEFPDEIIVIGGHMDTVPRDPGATDNAAGTATVLELARLYAQRGSKRTLRFAAWGSEEGGLVGSMKYVLELKKKHKDEIESDGYIEGYSKTELEKHLLNINLDVLGMSIGINAFNVVGSQPLSEYVKALTSELGVHHEDSKGLYGSDHLSFANVGVPGVGFARHGVGTHYMHTSRDDISLIDVNQLKVIGDLVDVFISRTAAKGCVWPFERSIPTLSPDLQEQLHRRIRYAVDFLGEDPALAK